MEKCVVLRKDDFSRFFDHLQQQAKIVAPVDRGANNYAFAEVTRSNQICLKYIPTILPPKKYFMPPREVIQSFDKASQRWTPQVEAEDLILFGVHTCDLSGIQFLNTVMAQEPRDVNYLQRQKKITVIGLECNDYCDGYASCHVMRTHLPSGGYDLFLTDLGEFFLIQVATPAGEKLVGAASLFAPAGPEHHQALAELRARKESIFKDEVDVPHDRLQETVAGTHEHPVWQDLDQRCVACGNCTNVCPTCYCFDIRDDLALDLQQGTRTRVWDGCQSENFARVAGGENFRKARGDRQRHRYMRKFDYPLPRFDRYTCTGCGRCSRTCMAQINLKETINALAKDVT